MEISTWQSKTVTNLPHVRRSRCTLQYSRDQLAKLRTDYVHEQQERYRTQLTHIAESLTSASGAERVRLTKQQNKLTEQLNEISIFEEKVHHLADMQIEIDLDDGVKRNYELIADVLAKI